MGKPRTKEEILVKTVELMEQMTLFEMELSYIDAQVKFRTTYEDWYNDRLTLDAALEAMMESMGLCRKISVWGAK